MKDKNIEAIYRLSPLQEGILFHTLEAARSGVYFEQYSCLIDGRIDSDKLELAWNAVAARHSVLRTLFAWERREKPLQIVRAKISLPWERQDWRDVPPAERESRWQSFLQRDRDRGFDLAQAPLTRFTLVRLGETTHRFLWSFHHILIDGWSMRLMLHEVDQLYQAYCDGTDLSLPRTRPYGDFIAWLDKVDLPKAKQFWTDALQGFDAPTTATFGNAAQNSNNGKNHSEMRSVALSEQTVYQLKTFSRGERLTLNTLVLGAWAIALSRYSGSNDVVFGTVLSGRSAGLDGLERMAGLFINTLPLRVPVPSNQMLISWLHDIQSRQSKLLEFEQTPLAEVQRWSNVAPGKQLFDTIVVFENVPAGAGHTETGNRLRISDETYTEYSNYPLAILAFPGDQLQLLAVHDPKKFRASDVDRMLAHLQTILEGMVHHGNKPVSAVSLLSEFERNRMLRTWNDTQAEFPENLCIHQLIEGRVERNPDAIAVAFEQENLSYGELNMRANRLAYYLKRIGVGKNVAVPIFLERSTEAIIALVAILKAGGAYVPLDPAFPRERVNSVLEDLANTRTENDESSKFQIVILTQERLLETLPVGDFRTFCLDRDWPELAQESEENLDEPVDPSWLAYIIYTSGSTGRPKGVMIPHRNLVNSTWARTKYYPEPLSSFLMLSSFATDSSIAGIFWTLCTGATLVLSPARLEQDILQLSSLIAEQRVSHMLCVPSLYTLVLEHGVFDQLASLETVIVAGESVSRGIVDDHYKTLPTVALYNEYGPTEATVWATVSRLDKEELGQPVTIGRPISNTLIYLLDNNMQPVPVGLPAELYIGGLGVALGYLNQPEETEAHFIHSPFASPLGATLYKTGDLARYLPDGRIEFLGRVDNQVKIRGYRVELEEIERALVRHPAIADAAVVIAAEQTLPNNHLEYGAEDPNSLASKLLSLRSIDADRLLTEIEQMSRDEIGRACKLVEVPGAPESSQIIERND